jgi:hypothetical protein
MWQFSISIISILSLRSLNGTVHKHKGRNHAEADSSHIFRKSLVHLITLQDFKTDSEGKIYAEQYKGEFSVGTPMQMTASVI